MFFDHFFKNKFSHWAVAADLIKNWSSKPCFLTISLKINSAIGLRQILPWQTNNTLIIFLYLHLNLVFLLKRLIFQGFPTFEFSFLFKVSSQIFSYFLVFFPAILVNPLVKQASLPTGFFNYSLSDILLPLHHQNSHGCKCSRLHWCLRDPWYTARFSDSSRILPY